MTAPPSSSSSSSSVPRLALGSQGLLVSAQGFGCMSLSPFNAPPKPEQEMIALLHHVVRSGVTFLDTSDIYGPHTNEILIGKALKGIRDEVQLATKFGTFIKDGRRFARGDPEYVRTSCEASLKRLDVDCIDLYYLHRVDTRVPIEITVGEMKKLVEEGKVKYLGLCEVSASTIRRAHAVHPITAVQLEWSLWSRDVEEEIVPACRELGIGIVPYSPLGRGFLSAGAKLLEHLPDNDWRKLMHERFQAGNVEKNEVLFQNLSSYAARKDCTPGQLALAWVQHQGEDVAPIPGTSKMKNFEENVGALSVKLRKEELQEIGEDIFPWSAVAGERYPDTNFTHLNSLTPPLSSWTGVREYHAI